MKKLLIFLLLGLFLFSFASANLLSTSSVSIKDINSNDETLVLDTNQGKIETYLVRDSKILDRWVRVKGTFFQEKTDRIKFGNNDYDVALNFLSKYRYYFVSEMQHKEYQGQYYFYADEKDLANYVHVDMTDICTREFISGIKADCKVTLSKVNRIFNPDKYVIMVEFTSDRYIDPSFAGGNGTAINPYQITNWTALSELFVNGTLREKYYILMNNLSSSTSDYTGKGNNWTPIGNSTLAWQWKGKFDGQNYTISDLIINTTTAYVGLFGYVRDATGASYLKNLRITNASIKTTSNYAGILAGYGWWDVTNVHVQGNIQANLGCGGLIGSVPSGALFPTLTDVSAIININCPTQTAGGLTGQNYGRIDRGYAIGNVTTARYGGGLTANTNFGWIRDSYSAVKVNCNRDAGGLNGLNGVNITNSYWDVNVSGKTTTVGGGKGYTTLQMKNISSFSNWTINSSSTNRNNGYPYLGIEIGLTNWYIWDGTTPSTNCWSKIGNSTFITTPCFVPLGYI
jgi:hypothetical protein